MADFTVRADHIDVEQIMRQIRARIRDKRGADYTEAEIRELASVKLDKFLDPRAVRSNLLQHYRGEGQPAPLITPEEAHPPLWDFNPTTVYVSDRGTAGRILTFIRKILKPISKLFFHVDTVWDVLTKQSVINRQQTVLFQRVHNRMTTLDALNFEMFNNLVVELTRLSIENKNLRMQVESFGARLDFDERRARALEGVVQYRPGAPVARPQQPSLPPDEGGGDEETTEGGDTRSARRRRRRRGRRRGAGEGGDPAQGAREQGAREPEAHDQGGQQSEGHEGQQGGYEHGGAPAYAMPSAEPEQSSYQQSEYEQPQHGQAQEQPYTIEHAIEQAPGGEPAGEPHYHSYAEPPETPASSPAHAPEDEAERQAATPSWEQPAAPAVDAEGEQAQAEQVQAEDVQAEQAEQAAPSGEPYQPYEPSRSDRPAPQRVFDTPRRSDTDSGEPGPSQS